MGQLSALGNVLKAPAGEKVAIGTLAAARALGAQVYNHRVPSQRIQRAASALPAETRCIVHLLSSIDLRL